jgi:hypothetical protein
MSRRACHFCHNSNRHPLGQGIRDVLVPEGVGGGQVVVQASLESRPSHGAVDRVLVPGLALGVSADWSYWVDYDQARDH